MHNTRFKKNVIVLVLVLAINEFLSIAQANTFANRKLAIWATLLKPGFCHFLSNFPLSNIETHQHPEWNKFGISVLNLFKIRDKEVMGPTLQENTRVTKY